MSEQTVILIAVGIECILSVWNYCCDKIDRAQYHTQGAILLLIVLKLAA